MKEHNGSMWQNPRVIPNKCWNPHTHTHTLNHELWLRVKTIREEVPLDLITNQSFGYAFKILKSFQQQTTGNHVANCHPSTTSKPFNKTRKRGLIMLGFRCTLQYPESTTKEFWNTGLSFRIMQRNPRGAWNTRIRTNALVLEKCNRIKCQHSNSLT